MHIVTDADAVEFIDGTGDKLVLRSAPRQRDVEASDDLERSEAFAAIAALKDAGVDTDAVMADAGPEAIAKATEDAAVPAKVRELRLKLLAVKLVIGGENIGGEAIVKSYRDMDAESAAWIDAKVAQVWDGCVPSDADTRGPGADVRVPAVVAGRTTT